MAKGITSGGGLKYKAQLDIAEALKNAQKLKAELSGMGIGLAKSFDPKPLTTYQAEQLKIKQQAIDLAKQKQEQAKAEKSASLVLQDALKQERLAREAINTQIAANRLAQQQANQAAKEQADLARQAANQKRPTQVSNSSAEIAKYNAGTLGTNGQVNTAFTTYLKEVKKDFDAGKISAQQYVAELERYSTVVVGNTNATRQQASANKPAAMSKRELAEAAALEALKEKEATAALKNHAREMFNAKGSLEQRRAALIRLTAAYDRLSAVERNTAAGMRLGTIVKGLSEQIGTLEQATNRGQRSVGQYGGAFTQLKSELVGAATGFLTLHAALGAIKTVLNTNVEASDYFTDVQRTAKLSTEEVDRLSDSLKKINTRTTLEGLLEIGFIGGRLGVAKEDIVGFIKQVDELAVVLKKEFPGGAEAVATSLGKIISVYKITQKEGITLEDALRKTGSAILELSHNGGAPVQYLQEFALGTAGVAQVIKLGLPTLLAYGSVLSKAGVNAGTAATNVTRFLSDLSTKREKYFAIAQLADANLTIEKFTNLIDTDAKQALEAFFKGLRAGNPTPTELGDRLKSLNLTAGKTKNTVIALSEAQDTLFSSTKLINKAYEEGTSVNHNFELANNSLAASFDKLKNSITNSFISSSFSRSLAEMLNNLTDNRTEAEKLAEEYVNSKHRADELDGSLKPLIEKYDDLKTKAKILGGEVRLSNVEQTELLKVTGQIGELLPGVVTRFNDYGVAIDINRGKVEDLTKAQRELLELQNRSALKKANEQFNQAQSLLPEAKEAAARAAKMNRNAIDKFLDFFQGGDSNAESKIAAKDRITRLSGTAYEAAKAVRTLGGELTKAQQEVINYYEVVKKPVVPVTPATIISPDGTNDDLLNKPDKTPEVLKAEIKALTAANAKLKVGSKELAEGVTKLKALKKELKLALGGTDNEGIKAENQYQSALKAQRSLQEKLNEAGRKGKREELDGDKKELAEKTAFYENLRKLAKEHNDKVDKFNNDPKNKNQRRRTRVDAGVLLPGEASTVGVLKDNIAAEELKNSLEDQKKIYEKFEQYKADFGEAKAKEAYKDAKDRYGNLIDLEISYLDKLAQVREKYSTDDKAKGGDAGSGDYVVKQIKVVQEAAKEAKDEQDTLNAEILKSTRTGQEIINAETEKYLKVRTDLIKKGKLENVKILDQEFKETKDSILANEFTKSALAKELAKDAIILTRSQIKEQITSIENGLKDVTIPKELRPRLQSQLDNLKLRLNIGADQANLDVLKTRRVSVLRAIEETSKQASPEVENLTNELTELNIQIDLLDDSGSGKVSGLNKFLGNLKDNKALEETSKWAGVAADGFNTMSQALGGVDTKAGYTLDTLGQLAGGISDLAAGLASGDPAQMIGAAIKAIGTIFSIGKKVKEMNAAARKEVADFYAQAISGEREYQDLLKERQIQRVRDNKIALQGIRDEVALRKSQMAAYEKESKEIMSRLQGEQYITSETYRHGTWFRKAEVNKTYASLKGMSFEQLSSLLSQGKLEGDAKALVERLKDLEQKGYDAAAAIADLAKQTSEIFTGTTADNLTDSLLNMFREGKTGAQDLADFFKDTMDNAALSIFKNKVLAQAMEDFYKQFDAAAQSGDELTSSEITTLQSSFNTKINDALKKFEDFQKIAGSSLTGSSASSASSTIGRGLTPITEVSLIIRQTNKLNNILKK